MSQLSSQEKNKIDTTQSDKEHINMYCRFKTMYIPVSHSFMQNIKECLDIEHLQMYC